MDNDKFEQFVERYGRDILRFCRITAGDSDVGDELYQDTMLKLTEKRDILNPDQNTKSYALSISMFLWKNMCRKDISRKKLAPMASTDALSDEGWQPEDDRDNISPEQMYLRQSEIREIQRVVAALPEKYRVPVYLFYSANTQIAEIAKVLHIPEGTVKTRMRKAKKMLKKELEALGYDR
ncbi:MAG: RNA polymerase sigma factor [Lachnospiraceae bacterium]|nr:RNA polymerase sigma factor [Lachnospiraceae bacterium]